METTSTRVRELLAQIPKRDDELRARDPLNERRDRCDLLVKRAVVPLGEKSDLDPPTAGIG